MPPRASPPASAPNSTPDSTLPEGRFDVAVIGAGIVGCALARRLTLDGARVVVLEKAAEVLDGASKGNSGILHTGFDAPEGSLELDCIKAGHAEYHEIRERLNLPLMRSAALVLAWTDAEAAALPGLIAQAQANGVTDVQALDAAEVLALEPGLAPSVQAGFRVPGEAIIDPWSAAHAYLLQALENGAVLLRGCEVTGGSYDGAGWRLETPRGAVTAGLVINAAGNYGDIVDQRLIGRTDFTLRPRKGQFVVYDKPAAALVGHILLPVPTKTTKGVVVCRTIWGNLLVGPTAEDQDERATATLVPAALAALKARGEAILPGLAAQQVSAVYAGLRPATQFKDYQIRRHEGQAYITVGGIRSTGLTAALGIARHVAGLAAGEAPWQPPADPLWPQMPMLAEDGLRDWQCAGNGGIVCHCEKVTRREVEAALTGPLAAQTLAGLKRRTRVTMGRCQGFYCTAELAEVTRGRLAQPMVGQDDGA
ncbi:NAD(P)/FAD-dependent oxidoreductase [Frigidibacter sp.]|uniref:NAD(P)/FAD-dependent oxidoreductase n=1 Tax=Frigidibacter sp. TaxID=2586418 RepID=UPI0027334E52|nr:NAD(P)/FAD-dependent oxidoreductase [Frigidibacter sp.]MDP3340026.1 NAD(P)/FAD-dependent oxidoreductase [Frigidibacter sp.]